MMKYLFVVVTLICYELIPGYSQKIWTLTTQKELNNGTINDIVQDTCGFMWFATWDGLMKYDGYKVINYKPRIGDKYSLLAKHSTKLFVDSRGNVWVGTSEGLCRYDRSKDRFIRYRLDTNIVRPIVYRNIFESGNTIYVHTVQGMYGLAINDTSQMRNINQVQIVDGEGHPLNVNFYFSGLINGHIFLIRRQPGPGNKIVSILNKANPMAGNPMRLSLQPWFSVNRRTIVDVTSPDSGRIYLGTPNGVFIYFPEEREIHLIDQMQKLVITRLVISSDYKLWVGTRKSGLKTIDLHSGEMHSYIHDVNKQNSLLGDNIFSIYEDFSKNLWVGHGGEGISILNLTHKQFETFRQIKNDPRSLGSNSVMCFNETQNEILIGTRFDGLNILKYDDVKKTPYFERVKMPSGFIYKPNHSLDAVWHIAKESPSVYWLGTNYGLIRGELKNNRWTFTQLLNKVPTIRRIFVDKDLNLWLGTYKGIYLLPYKLRNSGKFFCYLYRPDDPESISDNVVTFFSLDNEGNFWIGTQNGGLCRLKEKYATLDLSGDKRPGLRFQHISAGSKKGTYLNNNEINCIYQHDNGTLWVGTQGGGINIMNPSTLKFSYITTKEGLSGDDVFGILRDSFGNLWISTNKGLSMYQLDNKRFLNFSPSDGIQGNLFMVNSFYRSNEGRMYFGGRNGFTRFFPDRIHLNLIAPKIQWTDLKINNEIIHIGDTINRRVLLTKVLSETNSLVLKSFENNFSIGYVAIHYEEPAENKIEYILEGFDYNPTITNNGSGYIHYSNLSPGSYTLKLRAANDDNIWTKDPITMRITVLPPWWGTWWARSIFTITVLLILTGFVWLLLHRQNLAHQVEVAELEKRNLKNINESKLRFFTDISHELKTFLTLTIIPIDDLLSKKKFSNSYARNRLHLASKNARLLLRLTQQIIDFRKINAGKLKLSPIRADLGVFIKHVVNNFEGWEKKKEIKLKVILPSKPLLLWFDPLKMDSILYNLLTNAFKYTNYRGNILVKLSAIREQLDMKRENTSWAMLSVHNDGRVIPPNLLDKIFERFFTIENFPGGSGIGLTFTKLLVELHKGIIKVSSEEGKGTTFKVFLPITEKSFAEEETGGNFSFDQLKPPILVNEDDFNLNDEIEHKEDHDLSILMVDDNEELVAFFRSMLAPEYNFYEASNGQDALRIAEEVIPDIIVSDVIMPVMNGFELCLKLKNNIKTCHIPIILLTAKDASESKKEGFQVGADAYVVKPFEIEVLKVQIKRLIKNRKLIHENYKQFFEDPGNSIKPISKDDHFFIKVNELIEKNIDNPDFNVYNLANEMNLSSTQLYRKIKALTGYSSVEFIRIIKLNKAAKLLRETAYSVKEVCYMAGFNNPSYFVKCFREKFGVTPKSYKLYKTQKDAD